MPYDATDIKTLGLTAGLRLLLEDADRIEKLPPERFDMEYSGSQEDYKTGDCKTPSCIGGWVSAWARRFGRIDGVGAERWDLPRETVYLLMFPGVELKNGQSPYSATPAQAAQAMRNLAYTEAANPGHGDPMWETVG